MERIEKTVQHLSASPVAATSKLLGRCSCGSVSWEGRGAPEVSVVVQRKNVVTVNSHDERTREGEKVIELTLNNFIACRSPFIATAHCADEVVELHLWALLDSNLKT